ncbi:hypothetical protein ABTY63_15090 [Streptomyces solisilvae]|uniref:hypothetical protein n=1 Tax=Streptomyces malaysiensis TaxID=92644 RepID=UPI00332C5B9F
MRFGAHLNGLAHLLMIACRVVAPRRLGNLPTTECFYAIKDHADCCVDSALLFGPALYGINPDHEHCRDRQQSTAGDSCDNLARSDHPNLPKSVYQAYVRVVTTLCKTRISVGNSAFIVT